MSDFDARARKAADAVRQQIADSTPHPEKGIRRAQRSPGRVAIPGAIAAAAVLIAAVAVTLPRGGDGGAESSGPALSGGNGAAYAMAGVLKPFSTCDTVLEYFKEQAPEYLIQRAGGGGVATSREAGAPGDTEQRTANDSAGATDASPASPPEHSKTNVQEAGVDEPDIVKTDGNRIVAVAQGRVHLVGLDGGKMTLRKTLPTRWFAMCFFPANVCLCSAVKLFRVSSLDCAGQASRPP